MKTLLKLVVALFTFTLMFGVCAEDSTQYRYERLYASEGMHLKVTGVKGNWGQSKVILSIKGSSRGRTR